MFKVVQKFGGTSVGDLEKIKKAAQIIASERAKGSSVVAVVSAMAGVTDQLVHYAKSISRSSSSLALAEYDTVIASGEQITSGLLALALQAIGIEARSFAGWQLPIVTDSAHSNGRIMSVYAEQILTMLKKNEVPVVCGFQGVFNERIVTLGRGGSDTTAAAIAAAIDADRCDIFTDVEGVFTADPRMVTKAKKIDSLSYQEMLTIAASGAKVIHPRAVDIALRHNIETQVLSSFIDVPGTILVKESRGIEMGSIIAVVSDDNIVLLKFSLINNDNSMLEVILNEMTEHALQADIWGDEIDFKLIISKSNLDIANFILNKYSFINNYTVDDDIAKVTIVGNGLTENSIILQKIYQVLMHHRINILSIHAIDSKIAVLVKQDDKKAAATALHTGFGLDY